MFRVKVITIGRLKEAWLADALSEYEKRLNGKMEIEWMLVEKEEERQKSALKEPLLIALDLKGKELSSEDFSRKLFCEWGARAAFIIGGAEGLSPLVIKQAAFRWCLSPLTFTHQIVRLLLAEQLYRAIEIERGSSYHK